MGYASYTAGIEIQWDDKAKRPSPILYIYGNSDLLSSFKDATDLTDQDGKVLIEYRMTDDLVFIQEQSRNNKKAEAAQWAAQEGVVSPDGNVTIVDNHDHVSPLIAGFNVLYKDGGKPDYTVLTSPSFASAAWINNRYLVFDDTSQQLRVYDMQTKQSERLSDSMSLKTVSDGIITVDDGAGQGDVFIRYSFDKDGSIILSCDHQSFFMNQPWEETNP